MLSGGVFSLILQEFRLQYLHEHILTDKAKGEEKRVLQSISGSFIIFSLQAAFHIWRVPNTFGLDCLADSCRGGKVS